MYARLHLLPTLPLGMLEMRQAAACFAARAAGHTVATAHVDAHAFGGADYAIKAIVAVDPANAEANTTKERNWQYHHLLELQ